MLRRCVKQRSNHEEIVSLANTSIEIQPRSKWAFMLVSAPSKEQVDRGLLTALQRYVADGELACVYADQGLSDEFAKLGLPSSRLFIARNELFNYYSDDHPIHGNAELKLWAGIKMDPSVILLQDVSDRSKFPNSAYMENRKDILIDTFLTGHKVIVGLVADTAEAAASRFVSEVVEVSDMWRGIGEDAATVHLLHEGEDFSEVLRTRMVAAFC